MAKRKIFDELIEGVDAMTQRRERKLTLRSYKVELTLVPAVDSKFIRETRKRMRCSRAVFARKLRINVRTLEKWEQGRAKPNPQAAALVLRCGSIPTRWNGWRKWRRADGTRCQAEARRYECKSRSGRALRLWSG
jgi:putative transcriptional regulator